MSINKLLFKKLEDAKANLLERNELVMQMIMISIYIYREKLTRKSYWNSPV